MADKKGSLNADLIVSKVMENSLVRDSTDYLDLNFGSSL